MYSNILVATDASEASSQLLERVKELRRGGSHSAVLVHGFTVLVESSGMGITDRRSSVKVKEWDACTDCPAYDRCYDLCVARTLLHLAAQGYGMARAI